MNSELDKVALQKDIYWMKKALFLAEKAQNLDEVPVGALLVINGKCISKGFNMKEAWKTPLGHAEAICIQRASDRLGRWRLSDATLYVTLEPCVMCAGLLVQARVRRLVFGAKDPKGGGIESLYQIGSDPRLNHQLTITTGILEHECSDILKKFFKNKRIEKKS